MSNVDYTLCRYCRGYESRDLAGEVTTVIKHGEARMAYDCRCACHAEQVVSKAMFTLDVKVIIDVKEAFLRWAEETGLTQENFEFDEDAFAEWLAEELLDDCSADVTGPGVLSYESSLDGCDFDPLDGVDIDKLLALAVPLLPVDPEAVPLNGAALGMEPLFPRENGEI